MPAENPVRLRCHVHGLSDVLACAHDAAELAREAGLSERASWELSIAASELATNITKYAGSGTIELSVLSGPNAVVELVARDRGPGIRCKRDPVDCHGA